MIENPGFDVAMYTESIEGSPYLQMVEDVPDNLRKQVENYVRDYNLELLYMIGGVSQ